MPPEQYSEVSFYIVAHADDWQLFMQPNVYKDIVASGSKVVFIITTAGDAGLGETYWMAREEGAKSSVRFCLAPITTLQEASGEREMNSHIINYYTINNTVFYFFRLPDGNLNGNGFAAQLYQSLHKLKTGHIEAITAVDNSTAYQNWTDFCTTLQTVILFESHGKSNAWINYLDPDANANPNDHQDHVATGHATQEMSIIPGLRQALFVGYSVNNGQNNLHPIELFWKAGMFAAYEKAVFDNCGYSTLQESIPTYLKWCLSSARFSTVNP